MYDVKTNYTVTTTFDRYINSLTVNGETYTNVVITKDVTNSISTIDIVLPFRTFTLNLTKKGDVMIEENYWADGKGLIKYINNINIAFDRTNSSWCSASSK